MIDSVLSFFPRRSGILLFPDCPRFCRLMKTRNRRYPRVWDGRGQIWRIGSVSIFPTRPRFLRWSAIIPDKWKLKIVPSGTSAMDFAHYQSPKLLSSTPPIKNKHDISRESGTDFWRLSDISEKSAMAKSKIPYRLGFSRHMKTRLNLSLCQNLNSVTNRG